MKTAILKKYHFSGGNMSSEKWEFNLDGETRRGGGFRAHGYESLTAQLRRLGVNKLINESGYPWLDERAFLREGIEII